MPTVDVLFRTKYDDKGEKKARKGMLAIEKKLRDLRKLFISLAGGVALAVKAMEDAGKAAERLGRSDVVNSINGMNNAWQRASDSLLTFKVAGQDLLGFLGDAGQGAANLGNLISALAIKFDSSLSDEEKGRRAALLVQEMQINKTKEQIALENSLSDSRDDAIRKMDAQALKAIDKKIAGTSIGGVSRTPDGQHGIGTGQNKLSRAEFYSTPESQSKIKAGNKMIEGVTNALANPAAAGGQIMVKVFIGKEPLQNAIEDVIIQGMK